MIDCGEGAQLQMRHMKIKFSRLNHVFISHLHGDHCFGLPGLISTLAMLGRTGDLFIHGHKDVEAYISFVLGMFSKELPFDIRYNQIDTTKNALVMEDRSVKVYSIPLKHRVPTCGFLFEEKPLERPIIKEMVDFYQIPLKELQHVKQGDDYITADGQIVNNARLTRPVIAPRRYAYCSDTAFTPNIVPIIQGVDLLYHESTFVESERVRAKQTLHSTASQAAEIARLGNVKKLMLGHFSARYDDDSIFLEEAKRVFEPVVLAKEKMVYSL